MRYQEVKEFSLRTAALSLYVMKLPISTIPCVYL